MVGQRGQATSVTPSCVCDGGRGERRGESSRPARFPCNHLRLSAADRLEQENVCAAALRTFHPVIVGYQAALREWLAGKIPHERHIVVHSK